MELEDRIIGRVLYYGIFLYFILFFFLYFSLPSVSDAFMSKFCVCNWTVQDPDAVLSDPEAAVTAKADAAVTPEQTEDGISTRLNQDTGSG